jgi:hypothetical protein
MRKAPVPATIVPLLVALVATGCSATSPRATPTATISFAPVIFSGSLSGEQDVVVPEGAHSATITVVCNGQNDFSLSGAVNPDLAGVEGACGRGSVLYQLAVVAPRTLPLEIDLSQGGSFVVETRFSANYLPVDRELATQCSAMSVVESDVFNAEDGFTLGDVSADQWQQRVAAAAIALRPQLSDGPNILSSTLKALSSALTAPSIAPGALEGNGETKYWDSLTIISQVCQNNGDPLAISGEFGG